MNVFAFVLCLILLVMGKWRPQSKEKIARYVINPLARAAISYSHCCNYIVAHKITLFRVIQL